MVEIGCGGYPGNAHANPDILLNDDKALEEFKALLKKYNVEISALSCHGNPVHPNKEIAKSFDDDLRKAVKYCKEKAVNGDAVLLSPACASWDMFSSYEERGNLFKQYVREDA